MKSIRERNIKLNNQDINVDDKKTIEELSKKSESELLSELLAVASKQRKEGSLDNGMLDEFQNKISGSLNEEQQKRLSQIIGMLKK